MKEPVRVGLFATCLVDLFRPNVGFAAVKLLEEAGCEVEVPPLQTCCGQPAYNSGDFHTSREVAKQVIAAFEGFDYVVAPSGSCAAVLKLHYPLLFPTDHHWRARAEALAPRCFELMQFLVDALCPSEPPPRFSGHRRLPRLLFRGAGSSASTASRAPCSTGWRASSASRSRTPRCAAASGAPSASSTRRSRSAW